MSIDIIGAGIGGLTTAIALEQKGIKTRIFEQAETIKIVGAGIILASNAMQVYEKLGLRKTIEENGNPVSSLNITNANLKPISEIDLTYFEQKHKVKNIAIHKGTLQKILIDKLKTTEIHLGHKLTKIDPCKAGYSLHFENGKSIQSSTVIGADGLNSIVRKNLFSKTTIRNAKQICWRGVTTFNLPMNYRNELNEAWGKAERFGFVRIAKNKVYWYALKSFEEKQEKLSIDDIGLFFKNYNSLVKELIASTKKEHIHTAPISDLKPTRVWYKENVCLIGDAAHATTPNMGQGACQAIEDAFVLSECLNKYNIITAFEEYQKLRIQKAHLIVKKSWYIGKIAHIKSPFLVALRNLILRLTPSKINQKQNEQVFKLTTP